MTTDALRSTGSRTITRRAVTGAPSRAELVDAAFVVTLGMLALWGFRTSFDSLEFVAAGAIGILLGVAVAHVATVLRQGWLVLALMTVILFFLTGGAVALRADAGAVPGPAVLKELGALSVTGWKDFLTTLPPVDGSGPFLVLPYALALLVGVTGYAWARRSPAAAWPAAVPVLALLLVLLLGTIEPAAALLHGLAATALAFVWIALRRRRGLRIVGTGSRTSSQAVVGAALLVAALGASAAAVHLSPGGGERFVLRTVVAPPFDISQHPSPLVGFRKYTQGAKRYWDLDLLHVTGVPAGSRLRLAVLDDYSGTVWAARPPGAGGEGFRRVGTTIAPSSDDPEGAAVKVQVTVQKAYAGINDLNLWVPGVGSSNSITFGGPRAGALAESLRYDTATGQAVVSSRLRAGDDITLTQRPVPTVPEAGISLGSGGTVGTGSSEFVTAAAAKLAGKADEPWAALQAVAATLKSKGAYSDGTATGETQYLPGHSVGRLTTFLAGTEYVGNDEQYASTFALVANSLGTPARVVLGAVVPDGGSVRGQDVHAWVEVRTGSGEWYAVPETMFLPSKDKHPNQNPPPPVAEQNAADVPPPNAVRPPGSLDSLLSVDPSTVRVPNQTGGNGIPAWVRTVLIWVGIPLGIVALVVGTISGIHALRRRRRRRHGPASRRLSLGWTELVDRTRDLGTPVPKGLTRKEQAVIVGFPALAADADAAVFGSTEPSDDEITRYWAAVRTAGKDLVARSSVRRRLVRRFTLTSLLFRDPRPVETLPTPTDDSGRTRRAPRLRLARGTT